MSKEENGVYEFTHKVMMQIVDEQDKAFCELIQEDIIKYPEKYKNIELKVVGRDRIKELLTLGLNAEKQLAELKAENERLKENNKSKLLELFDDENKKLKQQLKEKDEEIEKLKSDYELLQKTYIGTCATYKDDHKELITQLQSNTKQVCEMIRKDIQRKLDGQRYNFSEYCKGKEFAFLEINDILDQIEKGE